MMLPPIKSIDDKETKRSIEATATARENIGVKLVIKSIGVKGPKKKGRRRSIGVT